MLDGLLTRGYFPQELLSPFNSKLLSRVIDSSGGIDAAFIPASHGKLVDHNQARTGSLRRKLSIPDPIHYAILCNELIKNFQSATGIY